MAKIGTNASGTTCWPNLEPMQVAFYLAGEITQVIDSIPWVRCASGNVYTELSHFWRLMVSLDYDGFSTHLMIILMIELGIWVIRASGNFIRSGPTFQG